MSYLNTFFKEIKNAPFLKGRTENIDTYSSLPPIDKEGLRLLIKNNFDLQKEKKGVYLGKTGGTLSESIIIPVDIDENQQQRKILTQYLTEENIFTPNTICINIFNYKHLYRSASVVDDLLEKCHATSIPLAAITPDEFIANFAKELSPNTIAGTPSRLAEFAAYVIENNINIHFDKIIFAGEVMSEYYLDIIKLALKPTNVYGLFGAVELGIFSYSNPNEGRQTYRIIPEIIDVEVLNPDENGFGELVMTNLIRKRFPIVKYKTRDIGRVFEEKGKQYFEIKGRGEFAFRINSMRLSENDFSDIVSDVNKYQIQISNTKEKRTKLSLVLISNDSNSAQTENITIKKEQIADLLKADAKVVEIEVKYVNANELIKNSSTFKTPPVVDLRHLT